MKRRALVIGLDSAPLSLLQPWIAKGHLPNLGRILGSGAFGDLFSRIPVTPIAWSSIYTGKNPGKHGILGFRNHVPGSYSDVGVNSTLREGRDIWEILGSHGKKVVVVNTPLTYPPRLVNGYLVCGFMAPGTEYEFTYPSSLGQEIKAAVPKYRIGTAPTYLKGLYLKELISTIQVVGEAAVYLLKKIDWDFAFIVFKETDEVQHSFFDSPERMLALYKRVDSFVGQFTELAGDDAHVFVVSDHGGEPIDKRFNVAEFLRRNSLIELIPTPERKSNGVFGLIGRSVFNLRLQWILDVPGSRRILSPLFKQRAMNTATDGSDGFYAGKIDWSKTVTFFSSGIGLRLNVKGREPQGIVDRKDFEEVRNRIINEFAQIKDPENGKNVFSQVLPSEKLLSGPHMEEAPDILFILNSGYLPTESLTTFDPLTVSSKGRSLFSESTLWCGTHTTAGVIAMSGPNITRPTISNATLEDVAPTILYSMGLPIPGDMDGRVLTEVFSEEHLKENPLLWESPEVTKRSDAPHSLSRQEEDIIEERLKALGYLS